MINYIAFGILIMFIIEFGSPYTWNMFERILIVILWTISAIIMIHALYERFIDGRNNKNQFKTSEG